MVPQGALSARMRQANLRRAYGQFNEELMEGCAKQAEFRAIIFALSYFHAALLERKKFGVGNLPGATSGAAGPRAAPAASRPTELQASNGSRARGGSGIGWNMNYPFNTGDLLCCGQCAANYLDNNARVPWDDLRYIFGEIMYGGHIVEDWDRRLASAYLQKYFSEGLLDGFEMFPGFPVPPSSATHRQVDAGPAAALA